MEIKLFPTLQGPITSILALKGSELIVLYSNECVQEVFPKIRMLSQNLARDIPASQFDHNTFLFQMTCNLEFAQNFSSSNVKIFEVSNDILKEIEQGNVR